MTLARMLRSTGLLLAFAGELRFFVASQKLVLSQIYTRFVTEQNS